MNLDEQFLEMTDKIRLIKLENENVSTETQIKNLKKAEKSTLSAFFFVFNLQCSNNVNSM